jgi:hypothetical protein
MAMKRFRSRSMLLLMGLAIGLLAGAGTAAGVAYLMRPAAPTLPPGWPQGLPLHASTAATSETMALATGRVDDQVEGLVTLDFLSGDLQCFVMNPRTGKFVGWFKTNVTTQLPVERGKKPAYVLTTGMWEPVGFSTQQRPAGCVIYVADANTGMFAAYTFPWVKGAASTGITQSTPMLPLDGNKARNIVLRQE